MYRNHEGYNDPTVGAVMSLMMKEYKRERRKQRRCNDKSIKSAKQVDRVYSEVSE